MVVAQKNPKFLIFRRSLVIGFFGVLNFGEKGYFKLKSKKETKFEHLVINVQNIFKNI